MLIVMKPSVTARDIDAIVNVVEAIGLRAHPMPGATRTDCDRDYRKPESD